VKLEHLGRDHPIPDWLGTRVKELGVRKAKDIIKLEDVLGEGNYDFTKAPLDEKTLLYTTQDAELAVDLEKAIIEENLKREKYPNWDEVYQLELDLLPILGKTGLIGLPLDHAKFNETVKKMNMEADDLHSEICETLFPLPPLSPNPYLPRTPKWFSSASPICQPLYSIFDKSLLRKFVHHIWKYHKFDFSYPMYP